MYVRVDPGIVRGVDTPTPSRSPRAAPTTAEVLDAELRMRGSSLAGFAAAHGLTPLGLVAMLDGFTAAQPAVLLELAELVGLADARALARTAG